MGKKAFLLLAAVINFALVVVAQHPGHHQPPATDVMTGIESQPLLAQAIRLKDALNFLGSSLTKEDERKLIDLQQQAPSPQIPALVQNILDPYCLAMVNINPCFKTSSSTCRGCAPTASRNPSSRVRNATE